MENLPNSVNVTRSHEAMLGKFSTGEARPLFVAEGRYVVRRLLSLPQWRLRELLLTPVAEAALRDDLARRRSGTASRGPHPRSGGARSHRRLQVSSRLPGLRGAAGDSPLAGVESVR